MSEKKNKLAVIDGETLMDIRLEPTRFCIDTLLPQGITILGGATKIGKSWWVLDICIRIAKGESVWGMPTTKGTTLYLCLEDTLGRVQERLNCITDDFPSNVFFATAAHTLAEGLCDEIRAFVKEQPEKLLPPEMELLVQFMKEQENFVGGNSEFVELFNRLTDSEVTVKGFKQMMNRWRYDLENLGVHYRDHRSNGARLLEVKYIPSSAVGSDESAVSDEINSV